jgi:hypothetical protein
MKSFTNRLVVFAAGAAVPGTMAYGQTVKAEIPFAFHTANAGLPAGNYMRQVVNPPVRLPERARSPKRHRNAVSTCFHRLTRSRSLGSRVPLRLHNQP